MSHSRIISAIFLAIAVCRCGSGEAAEEGGDETARFQYKELFRNFGAAQGYTFRDVLVTLTAKPKPSNRTSDFWIEIRMNGLATRRLPMSGEVHLPVAGEFIIGNAEIVSNIPQGQLLLVAELRLKPIEITRQITQNRMLYETLRQTALKGKRSLDLIHKDLTKAAGQETTYTVVGFDLWATPRDRRSSLSVTDGSRVRLVPKHKSGNYFVPYTGAPQPEGKEDSFFARFDGGEKWFCELLVQQGK